MMSLSSLKQFIMTTEKQHRITLRVEKQVKNGMKRVALKNGRSVNSEIIVAMREHVEKHELSKSKSKTL